MATTQRKGVFIIALLPAVICAAAPISSEPAPMTQIGMICVRLRVIDDGVVHLFLWSLAAGGAGSPGYWVPAAQVPHGLAVLPLDGVFEQMGQPPAGGDAGDVGDPAAGPDGDDEPFVVEGERLQRPVP